MAERISDEGKTGIIKLTRNLQLLKPVLTSDGIFTDTITLNNSFLVLDFQNWTELEYDNIDDLYQLNIGASGTTGTGGLSQPISIFDEGNLITSNVSSINFVGEAITAEILDPLNPNAVTVTVLGLGTSGQGCSSCNEWYINNTRSLPLPSGTSGYGQASLDASTPQSVTTLIINKRDYSSLNINQSPWLDSWDDTGNYGYIQLKGKTSGAYLNGYVTFVAPLSDYYFINITVLSYGVLSFTNEELCICFTQSGATGVTGESGTSGTSFYGVTSGTSGTSGSSGTSGESGTSGTSFY